MPIKNVSVLWKIYTRLFKRIFRAFSVIFCVSPWAREGYCAHSTHESLKPSFFCLLDLAPISKIDAIKYKSDGLFVLVRVTNLLSIHMFLGLRNPIKRIFRVFSVILVYFSVETEKN